MLHEPAVPPLDEAELESLASWQRRMVAGFILAMLLMLGVVLADALLELPRWTDSLLIAAWIAVLLAGGWLQLSRRCPRCGACIGLQSRLVLPPCCVRCGVRLRRPQPPGKA